LVLEALAARVLLARVAVEAEVDLGRDRARCAAVVGQREGLDALAPELARALELAGRARALGNAELDQRLVVERVPRAQRLPARCGIPRVGATRRERRDDGVEHVRGERAVVE